jgi:hypothetical protein
VVDPYDWLGVPKGLRPPTHYQLLGLDPAVAEPAAVRVAADRQLRRILPHLTGPDALQAEQIWSELEEARDVLLDPDRRAHYDATIPMTATAAAPAGAALNSEPVAPDITAFEEPPAESAGDIPWWKAAPPPDQPAGDPWWKQPLPKEPIAPPPASMAPPPAALVTATHTSTALMPAARHGPRPGARDLVPEPRKGRGQGNRVFGLFLALLVAGAIAGGMYYAFGRKTETTTTPITSNPNTDQPSPAAKVEPKPGKIANPPPKVDEPVVAEVPLPKDFADQLKPKTFTGHAGAVNAVTVAKSGSRFATIGADRTVRLWSVARDASVVRHTFSAPGVGVAWADHDRLLVAADGFNVAVADPLKKDPPRTFDSPRGGVSALAVTPDGSRAVNGLSDSYLRVWNLVAGRSDERPVGDRGSVTAVDVSPDGARILAAVQDGPVTVWELSGLRRVFDWSPGPGGAIAVRFSPNGQLAATAGPDGTAEIYDLTARREVCRMTGHTGPVTGIAWQPGGRQVVTVGVDGTARLWNAETGQPIRWVQTLNAKGTCVAVDPGDRFVLAGTSTGMIHLFPLPRVKGEAVIAAKPPAEPLPVPDPDAVVAAVAAAQKELEKEYKFTRADDVSILADNLRRRAAAANVAPAVRYGLLQESRTLALRAGDSATAIRSVEDLAAWFDVDELAEKANTLAAMPGDADPVAVVAAGIVAAERAETDARPELVSRLLGKLPDPAELPKDLSDRLAGLRQRSTTMAKERQAVVRALDLLKDAPDDQGANQTAGLFYCLARQDWGTGLPYLVKGSDVRLVETARADLNGPTDPKAQHHLGELWFAFAADARDNRAKRAYLGRARTWFEREAKAKLELTDSIKNRAKLDDINKLDVPSKDPATLPLYTPVVVRRAYNSVGPDELAGEWKLDAGAVAKPEGIYLPNGEPAMHSRFGLAPGGKLTMSLRPDGREVRVNLGGQEAVFAAHATTFRLVIERKEAAVTVTAIDGDGEPVVRTIDLSPSARGPTALTIRLTGTPARPTGALLTAAVARGPASLPPPTHE